MVSQPFDVERLCDSGSRLRTEGNGPGFMFGHLFTNLRPYNSDLAECFCINGLDVAELTLSEDR